MPYRMNIQEVVQETYSDLDKGLSEQEAAARLRDQGKNELLKKKKGNCLPDVSGTISGSDGNYIDYRSNRIHIFKGVY